MPPGICNPPKMAGEIHINYHAQQFFFIFVFFQGGHNTVTWTVTITFILCLSFVIVTNDLCCYFCTGMNQVCTQGPSIFQTSSQAWLNLLLAELVHPVLTMECLIAAHRRYGDLKHLYRWIMPILVCQMSIFYFKLDLPDAFFQ